MRRDYFSLDIGNIDWLDGEGDPEKPRVTIDFEGPTQTGTLRTRLTGMDDEPLTGSETDAAFRLQPDGEDRSGVFSLTNRLTGEYILELNEEADTVMRFIKAARSYGERVPDADSRYQIRIRVDDDEVVTFDKRTFLVYNDEGNLLRKDSLIPSGVEL